jgi:chromosome partitioning protein
MKIITFLNEKGGVGKTTLSTHIAAGLAIAGHRVVLADADPQGSATYAVGFDYEPGMYNLLVRNEHFKDVLRFVSPEVYEVKDRAVRGRLFLLPSNVETRNIASSINDALSVVRRFQELDKAIDYVIFDTSPTPSLLHGAIYLATDAIIYPTTCEALSMQGLLNSFEHRRLSDVYRKQQGLSPIVNFGIVPMMFRRNTLEHRENLEELKSEFGEKVWHPISQSTIWTEASRIGRMVWVNAPESRPAKEALRLVHQFKKVEAHVWSS